jgi:hypothetical protein
VATSHGVRGCKSPADRTSPVLPCMLTALGVSVWRMLLPSSSTACYCALAKLGNGRALPLRYALRGFLPGQGTPTTSDGVRDGRTGWLVTERKQLTDVAERAVKELAAPARR